MPKLERAGDCLYVTGADQRPARRAATTEKDMAFLLHAPGLRLGACCPVKLKGGMSDAVVSTSATDIAGKFQLTTGILVLREAVLPAGDQRLNDVLSPERS
jgi:hypothetical protein